MYNVYAFVSWSAIEAVDNFDNRLAVKCNMSESYVPEGTYYLECNTTDNQATCNSTITVDVVGEIYLIYYASVLSV